MNQVTSASLRYPLSVFNKNSTLKFPVDMESVVVAYSLKSTDVVREVLGSKPTIVSRICINLKIGKKDF